MAVLLSSTYLLLFPCLSQLVLAVLHSLVRPLHLSLVIGLFGNQSLSLLVQNTDLIGTAIDLRFPEISDE